MPAVHARGKTAVNRDPYYTTYIRKINESYVKKTLANRN